MRIIAGTARGRRLKSPTSNSIRPTGDRVRESLFSMLGDLKGAVVVDAFAGTGALGLEALSRGAEKAYFFDVSKEAIETIEENVRRVDVEQRATVKRSDFIEGLVTTVTGTPDLFFFDPPYGSDRAARGLEAMIGQTETVTPGALVVWESGVDEEIPIVEGFEVVDEREYGTTRLVFFRRLAYDDVNRR